MVKFSILTASIGRDTLGILYENLKNQTYKEFEWIIVFDGKRAFNPLVKGFNQVNTKWFIHQYHTSCFGRPQRREAQRRASGDFIIWCDDDDYLKPNCLQIASQYYKKYELIVWRTYADFMKKTLPGASQKGLNGIDCGQICSNSYAIKMDLAEKIKYPLCDCRRVFENTACDFYYFRRLRMKSKKSILLKETLAVARHSYPGRGKEPKWVSRFGH